MLYTELTKKAMVLAYRAHEGQLDKGGVPYIFHPFHVAEQMNTEEEICVALMHDVVEDTDITFEEIEAEGFPKSVVDAIRILTKADGEDYMDYITRVKDHPLAVKVKLADLEHNSDASRLPGDDDYNKRLLDRYMKARVYLVTGEKP